MDYSCAGRVNSFQGTFGALTGCLPPGNFASKQPTKSLKIGLHIGKNLAIEDIS